MKSVADAGAWSDAEIDEIEASCKIGPWIGCSCGQIPHVDGCPQPALMDKMEGIMLYGGALFKELRRLRKAEKESKEALSIIGHGGSGLVESARYRMSPCARVGCSIRGYPGQERCMVCGDVAPEPWD